MNNTNASRDLMIPKALSELQETIETLAKVVTELSLRLEWACVPNEVSVSVDPTTKAPIQPAMAGIVTELFSKAQQLRNIRSDVERLLVRLEL